METALTISAYVFPGLDWVKRKEIDIEKRITAGLIKDKNKNKADEIEWTVCDAYGITRKQMKMKCRERETSLVPRQIAMKFEREMTSLSFAQIGARFGKDHATVLHACKTIQDLCDTDKKFRQRIDDLRTQINP